MGGDGRLANEEQRQAGFEHVEIISMEDDVIDRLSDLPDCLLIHILSFLGLEKAVITSVLGKRWKLLWTELPTLAFDFYESSGEKTKAKCDFVDRVHKTLATRSGKSLEKLEVTFMYNKCFASDVDSWLEMALKLKVKHVDLSLDRKGGLYTLNKETCSCSSLTSLSLDGCIIEPEIAISWKSLTSLGIYNVFLPQPVVENILLGCPALESLYLKCWGSTFLQIESQSLCTLMIHDPGELGSFDFLQISAPKLKSLKIWILREEQLKLSNISSLVSASFHFTESENPCSAAMLSTAKEIFEKTQYVNELELGRDAIRALAVLLTNDWQLPKSKRRLLATSISNDAESISCILALLESSPYLETLIIDCDDDYGEKVPLAKGDLCCDMQYLKTVKLSHLADAMLGGKPLRTMAKIILKRAPGLKEMEIVDFSIQGGLERDVN